MQNEKYLSGFKNYFETETENGLLPTGQNSPQKITKGLYAEQISGSGFTAPRSENFRTWVYRARPSVKHSHFFTKTSYPFYKSFFNEVETPPEPYRWNAIEYPSKPTSFLEGVSTLSGNGDLKTNWGSSVHWYAFNENMEYFFQNSDGDYLFVPVDGSLSLKTEMGELTIAPCEIAVIPRGIKFQVHLKDQKAKGYLCENFGPHFNLPELGPIGSNGLANPQDFFAPIAKGTDQNLKSELIVKFNGSFWRTPTQYHAFDVLAWRGNYYPYKYDLKRFNTIGTVSFDHPDPSIFTVLTSSNNYTKAINVDFVIFPERWMVAEHTFRPPYYHRNVMSEFMGLIKGQYDAKPNGFVSGGASLHNAIAPHGPDAESFNKAVETQLKPEFYANTLAIMFESSMVYQLTPFALETPLRQKQYLDCWKLL